jgi:hypothetical protein
VDVGGTGVGVGGTGVSVGGTGVAVGGTGVIVGGTAVSVGIGVGVSGTGVGVSVIGPGVSVGGTGVGVGTGVAVGGRGVTVKVGCGARVGSGRGTRASRAPQAQLRDKINKRMGNSLLRVFLEAGIASPEGEPVNKNTSPPDGDIAYKRKPRRLSWGQCDKDYSTTRRMGQS